MTDETPSPKRKRRRWIIAGVLLFVVGFTAWWNWPRGDARFVGKWSYRNQDGSQSSLTFFANGSSIAAIPPNYRVHYSWRVENEKLINGFPTEGRLQATLLWLVVQVYNWTGTYYAFLYGEQEIVEVTQDRVVLKRSEYGVETTTVLTRIPE